jgi:hypothetical protein
MSEESLDQDRESTEGETQPADRVVSIRKAEANRQNALKSTGPKTPQGKAYSRGNALTHGLTAKRVMFGKDGKPTNEELHELWDKLHAKYGADDVVTSLLMDTVVVECWRQGKGLDMEIAFSAYPSFAPSGVMNNLQRYRTASQRALVKSLEMLIKLSPSTSRGAEDAGESDAITLEAESPLQAEDAAVTATEERPSQPGSAVDDEVVEGAA